MSEGNSEPDAVASASEDASGPTSKPIYVNRVSIRTPPFSKNRPALWFASLASQYHINNITQENTGEH